MPGTGAEALPDEGRVDTLLASVRLEPGEVGLFLDAGPVTGPSRKALTPRVLEALTSPPGRPWRSVCLASGAFPLNLAGFPRSRATPVARGDARLWRDIAERWRGTPPDHGDLGVTHLRVPPRSRGRPDPNMRYTTGSDWQVFVCPRGKAGNDDFFDLSADLVSSPPTGPPPEPAPPGATNAWRTAPPAEATRRAAQHGGAPGPPHTTWPW
ncbi:Uncharacterised protein [Streptomyces griseus]|uniref:Uncharacterized protein n=1 Tax=Streptomyces griseus TaxID=1911 RepID=A0A380MRA3_STRGR|nr:Uncharacterised protein [Streptomyces griseus]